MKILKCIIALQYFYPQKGNEGRLSILGAYKTKEDFLSDLGKRKTHTSNYIIGFGPSPKKLTLKPVRWPGLKWLAVK